MENGKKIKKGSHSFYVMAYWIYLMHIGILGMKNFME